VREPSDANPGHERHGERGARWRSRTRRGRGATGSAAGCRRPQTPRAVEHLPPGIHDAYVSAFAASLQPVFLVGAAVGVAAFLLTWLFREVPLRQSTGETAGERLGLAAADKTAG
jgi:hypothetical protein